MNIVFLDTSTIGEVPNLKLLDDYGNVTYFPTTKPNQTKDRIKEADIVITNKVVIDKALMENSPNLKLICIAATGMNNVDLTAAEGLGIQVKNVEGYASHSVAQCTFSAIFSLIQNTLYYDDFVKSGEYSDSEIFTNVKKNFWEIRGKQFGIIGLGNIGQTVAEIAKAFGANVVYYSTSGKNLNQDYRHLELNDLLKTSDIVSIHAPLNDRTKNLIQLKQLRLMKSSALLVNMGRGGIIHEADLAKAIDQHEIAGAALDVFAKEPIGKDNPLLKVRNKDRLVLTPHNAWASVEARTALMEGVRRNIEEYQKKSS